MKGQHKINLPSASPELNILFLHIPKKNYFAGRLVSYHIMILPLGFVPLAALAEAAGCRVQIVHTGVEEIVNPDFSIESYIAEWKPDVVGLSIHWHPQLYESLQGIIKIKTAHPGIKILVGGMTAAAFHREIMERYSHVDYVIRGDGEVPLESLISALRGDSSLGDVPNLTWRDDEKVIANPLSYSATAADLDRLNPTHRDLIHNYQFYSARYLYNCMTDTAESYAKEPVHYIYAGRGCSVDCAYCAGAQSSTVREFGRTCPVFRSVPVVADEMLEVYKQGIRNFYLCFDPPGCNPNFYPEIFRIIRGRGIQPNLVFEYYNNLPSDDFIRDFADTFDPAGSEIYFSPGSAVTSIRKKYIGAYYPIERLEESVDKIRGRGFRTTHFVTIFPDDNWKSLVRTARWGQEMRSRYDARILPMPIEMEPAAPWQIEPERFGIVVRRKTFLDFLQRHADMPFTGRDFGLEIGYDIEEINAKQLLLKMACEDQSAALTDGLRGIYPMLPSCEFFFDVSSIKEAVSIAKNLGERLLSFYAYNVAASDQYRTHLRSLCRHLKDVVRFIPIDYHPHGSPIIKRVLLPPPIRFRYVPLSSSYRTVQNDTIIIATIESMDEINLWVSQGRIKAAAEECRWGVLPCPATQLKKIMLRQNTMKTCLYSPDFPIESPQELMGGLQKIRAETEVRRGCVSCAANDRCPRCIFTAPFTEDEYCGKIRQDLQDKKDKTG
ncbi:MAG: cobalamin-dependent protein [bacterium]